MTTNVNKLFCKSHIYQILLWIISLLVILYILPKLSPFVFTRDQIKTTLHFEISKDNHTKIVSSQDNSSKDNALLFIAVLTHWRRWKRRQSIRETWMTHCKEKNVRCLFFTDDVGAKEYDKRWLKNEMSRNNDTILMPMAGNCLTQITV